MKTDTSTVNTIKYTVFMKEAAFRVDLRSMFKNMVLEI